MVKSVLHSRPGNCHLPVVVYLRNIAVYRDTWEQVLEDTLEAVKWFATDGFMLNLYKKPVGPSRGTSSWASLDLRWLLGAQCH